MDKAAYLDDAACLASGCSLRVPKTLPPRTQCSFPRFRNARSTEERRSLSRASPASLQRASTQQGNCTLTRPHQVHAAQRQKIKIKNKLWPLSVQGGSCQDCRWLPSGCRRSRPASQFLAKTICWGCRECPTCFCHGMMRDSGSSPRSPSCPTLSYTRPAAN